MSQFVNVAAEGNPALFLDLEKLTAVLEIETEQGGKKRSEIAFYTADGEVLRADKAMWHIDTQGCLDKLKAGGHKLIGLEMNWPDENDTYKSYGRVFVKPDAFNYIITSKAAASDGKTEESAAILMGIDGYGLVETFDVPASKIDEILNAVRAVKPDIQRIDADQATCRFVHPGFVVFDPAKITRVYQNGYDVNIDFENGGRADFNLVPYNRNIASEYANRLYRRLQRNPAHKDQVDLEEIFKRGYKYQDKERKRLRETFADAVSARVPGLTKIENVTDGTYYTRLDTVSWIQRHENMLSLHYRKAAGERYAADGRAYFKNEQAAEVELQRLVKLTGAGPNP